MEERRKSHTIDDAKFATQKVVTYILLLIFAAVAGWVLYENDQSERSMILQTVINLTLLAVGYWLGASKAAADSAGTVGKIAEQAAPSQALAVAAARGPAPSEAVTPDPKPDPNAVTPAPKNPETGVIPAAEAAAVQPKEQNQ